MPRPTPPGWPRVSVAIFYKNPAEAIAWIEKAFGFTTRLKVEGENGAIVHSELEYGDGVIMIAGEDAERRLASPRSVGDKNTQHVMVYVDDAEAHCKVAREAGAKITVEPKTSDYGDEYWSDRSYQAEDPEGHRWWFAQRLRTGAPKA